MSRFPWLILLGCAWIPRVSAQELLGKWEDTATVTSLEINVGPGLPQTTITAGLARAAALGNLGVTPVTINVLPGFYSAEAFPIPLPAHGVTIEAATVNPTRPVVSGAGSGAPSVFVFNTVGNLALPDSTIRGLEIHMDSNPVTRDRADIRISAAPNVPPTPPERVAPEIRDCIMTGDVDSGVDIGVDIVSVANTLVIPILERNHIFSNVPLFGLFGVRILGGDSRISPVVRSNTIDRFATNVFMTGGGLDCRPRIQSNFIQVGTANVDIVNCAPFVVSNTIAFAISTSATVPVGIRWNTGVPELELDNNCIWNPPQGGPTPIEVAFTPPFPAGTAGRVPFFNYDGAGTLIPFGPNFGPPSPPSPLFAGGDTGGFLTATDLHLTGTSGLIDLGFNPDCAAAGPGPAVIAEPLGAAAPTTPIRRDFGYDRDFDSRITMANVANFPITDIGADEFVPRGTGITPVPAPTFG